MIHGTLSCLILCVALGQENQLEVANVRGTYGYLGPSRPKGIGALPGDTAHFTFEVKNLKLDDEGKAFYSIAIEIRDEDGKIFFEQKPYNSVARNYLGGQSLPVSAHIEIPLDVKPGMRQWKITVKDRTTNQTAVLEGKAKILPADFGIVQVGLFADPEARVPVSAIGTVGDAYYIHYLVVGFDRGKDSKQPDVKYSMRVLDEQGKETTAKAMTATVNSDVNPKERMLPIQFGLTLNRTGRFTVELSAEDRISGKASRVQYPLRVLALD